MLSACIVFVLPFTIALRAVGVILENFYKTPYPPTHASRRKHGLDEVTDVFEPRRGLCKLSLLKIYFTELDELLCNDRFGIFQRKCA